MFPRSGGYVDEALVLENGTTKAISTGAGITVLAYFSSDAVGSVDVTLSNGLVLTLTAPSGGGKILTSRNETEIYGVDEATLDTASLSAGSVQVSLY